MSDLSKLKQKIRQKSKPFESNAVLGRADGTVSAGENTVYVTLLNGNVIEIYNEKVPLIPFRRIKIGYTADEPDVLQVLKFAPVYTSKPQPNIPNHKESHFWYGHDPIDVYLQQFMPLLPRAIGGLTIRVYGGDYVSNDVPCVLATTDFDMTAEIPASGAEWVSVFIDENKAITYQHGVNKDSREVLLPADKVVVSGNKKLLFSVKMYVGLIDFIQTRTDTDIYDPRMSVNGTNTTPPITLDDLLDVYAPSPANGASLIYDECIEAWVAEVSAGGGDMLAATYDPQAIAADAFNTDNHTDGITNGVYTQAERSKLSGIETGADVTDIGNVGAALNGAAADTPLDADTFNFWDAVDAIMKEITWANIKGYFSLLAHGHSGTTDGSKLAQANTHESADTDNATSSLHHTIGATATTAAAGNHSTHSFDTDESMLAFIQLANSKGDIYDPGTDIARVDGIELHNSSNSSTETVILYFHDGTNEYEIFHKDLLPNETVDLPFLNSFIVNAASKITGNTTTASTVTCSVVGSIVTSGSHLAFIQLANAKGDVYDPGADIGKVQQILLCNTNTTTETVTLYFHNGTNEFQTIKIYLEANETFFRSYGEKGLPVNASSKITGFTTTAAKVTCLVLGGEHA